VLLADSHKPCVVVDVDIIGAPSVTLKLLLICSDDAARIHAQDVTTLTATVRVVTSCAFILAASSEQISSSFSFTDGAPMIT